MVHASINAGGSSTYANALTAAKMLAEERPGCQMKIRLVDSHTYSMVFGWYLCECARKVRNGAAVADAVLEMEEKFAKVEVCLAAYSLKQMKKSGRVSAAAAFAGELLGPAADHQPERRRQARWRPRSAATRTSCPPCSSGWKAACRT